MLRELFGKLQSVTIAIFIAIFFAIVVYIILNKTAFGYELRACGFNKNAARYAGIRIDDFAQIAGVSKQFMTDLENGKDTVRMGMVLSLLQRMSVHVSLDLPDSAVDLYNAELEKVTRRRTTKKAPEG